MATLNLSVTTGANDGHAISTTFNTSASTYNLGNAVSSFYTNTVDRFTGASAIIGSSITQALFRIQFHTTDAGETVHYTVQVENADSPTMPTSVSDMNSRVKTSGTAWSPTTPASISYLEVDIKNEIQILADRPGFTGEINIFMYNVSTASGQRILRYFYDSAGNPGAQLNITYSAPVVPYYERKIFNPFKSFIKGY
jgi:hypothetical protein